MWHLLRVSRPTFLGTERPLQLVHPLRNRRSMFPAAVRLQCPSTSPTRSGYRIPTAVRPAASITGASQRNGHRSVCRAMSSAKQPSDDVIPPAKQQVSDVAPLLFAWTVPNVLTVARFALVPIMVGAWFCHSPALAAQIFVLAAVTDALDGYVARKFPSQRSEWGAFMDPVADKVLVCSALVLVSTAYASEPLVGSCAMVLISREIAVSALREFGARRGSPIPVDTFGKAKTALQCVALSLLLWQYSEATSQCGKAALVGASILSAISAFRYARPVLLGR